MREVKPQVFLIGETRIIPEGIQAYLEYAGAPEWSSDATSDIEKLTEFYGKLCYKSFKVGLNPNIRKVRESNRDYIKHVIDVEHGSVTEHGSVNFVFADVSRVFTHELVRHRAGVAISQESLRFVRLTDLGFWAPTVIRESPEAMEIMSDTFRHLEGLQIKLADLFKIDEMKDFGPKKELTSAFRRIAPIGLATSIGWTANIRTLRHVLEMRTDPPAEEEIRCVFGQVGLLMRERYPNLFQDYTVTEVNGYPHFQTEHRKV